MEDLKEVLKKDHLRLISLLDNFLNTRDGNNLIIFINNAERHFEIENGHIYRLGNIPELKEVNLKILEDHKRFRSILKTVNNTELFDLDLSALKEIREPLLLHNAFEDENFYPVLDKKLNTTDKNQLIEEIKDEMSFALSN